MQWELGSIEIRLLADHPAALPILRDWFEREWEPYYGPNGPGDAEQDLLGCMNRDTLPLGLVAMSGDEVCGTAALKETSVTTHAHLGPWLAALLVTPEYRRRGVAGRLIAAIEEKARQLGFGALYVGTGEGSGTPESTLVARGWTVVDRGPYFVSEVVIMRKEL